MAGLCARWRCLLTSAATAWILSFVISHNLHRPHLTESQRAMVAERLATISKGLHKSDAQICASQPEAGRPDDECAGAAR
jgi:hypothetical protein